MTTNFEQARQVADAVLYEGYVLYPYRASAIKNRYRWQFGVVAPRAYSERAGTDPWFMAAEFLVEPAGDPELSLELRFLQIEERQVEALLPSGELVPIDSLIVAGETHTTWQEGVVQTVGPRTIRLLDAVGEPRRIAVSAPHATSGRTLLEGDHRRGRVTRRRWAVDATLLVSVQPMGALLKVAVRIEFNARIDKVRSRLHVMTPAGDKTDVPIDQADDPNVLTGTTADLTPGAYVLRWQVLAIDGHITRGDIPFVVGN